jgi:YD repeat-containing protein
MSDVLDVHIIDDYDVIVELTNSVVYVSSASTGDFVSYAQEQQLTLTQHRQVRRNLNMGSAPTLTYNVNGRLTSIAYADGSSKTFTYDVNSVLTTVQFTAGSRVYTKSLSYADGRLASITETIIGV